MHGRCPDGGIACPISGWQDVNGVQETAIIGVIARCGLDGICSLSALTADWTFINAIGQASKYSASLKLQQFTLEGSPAL